MPIYRKGDDLGPLQDRAMAQWAAESRDESGRRLSGAQRYERDSASGVQGAKDIVNLGLTVEDIKTGAFSHPKHGLPVSGAALAKAKANKRTK